MALEVNADVRYPRMPDTRLVIRESSPISPRPPKLLDRVREANRLRDGSRTTEKSSVGCAAAVWGSPEKVPFVSVPMDVIRRVLQFPPPPAGTPGTFTLADEHVLERSFTQAGFAEVAIERQTLTFEYTSLQEFIEERPATSASIRIMLAGASAAQRETIWQTVAQEIDRYQDAAGVLHIPNETLCVVGKA